MRKFKDPVLNGHHVVWHGLNGRLRSLTPLPIKGVTTRFVYVQSPDNYSPKDALAAQFYECSDYKRLDRAALEADGEAYLWHSGARRYYAKGIYLLNPDLSDYVYDDVTGGMLTTKHMEEILAARRKWAAQRQERSGPIDFTERMQELKSVMQANHPDKGGNVDLFIHARAEYDTLKIAMRRRAA